MAKTEQGSSRMDTVLKMLLIAFVSLLAFSSGVYFGKQMSDSDHQMKALESDFNTQSYAAGEKGEGEDGEAMGEEEVAALSDKYVNGEKETAERGVASTDEHGTADAHGATAAHGETAHAAPVAHAAAAAIPAKKDAHGETAHAAPAAAGHAAAHAEDTEEDHHAAPAKTAGHAAASPANSKPDLSAAHKAAERVANNAAPTAPAAAAKHVEESRVPTSLPKTVGANNAVEFTVQVASYPTAVAAKEHADELVKKGFPAFPVEATISGRTWYRVSVGSFKTMKDATTYRAQLLKQADLQNAIVQKITR